MCSGLWLPASTPQNHYVHFVVSLKGNHSPRPWIDYQYNEELYRQHSCSQIIILLIDCIFYSLQLPLRQVSHRLYVNCSKLTPELCCNIAKYFPWLELLDLKLCDSIRLSVDSMALFSRIQSVTLRNGVSLNLFEAYSPLIKSKNLFDSSVRFWLRFHIFEISSSLCGRCMAPLTTLFERPTKLLQYSNSVLYRFENRERRELPRIRSSLLPKELEVGHFYIEDLTSSPELTPSSLPHLTRLGFSYFDSRSHANVEKLFRFGKVRTLALRVGYQSPQLWREIAKLPNLTSLKLPRRKLLILLLTSRRKRFFEFNVSFIGRSVREREYFRSIVQMTTLTHLTMYDDGFDYAEFFANLTHLRSLYHHDSLSSKKKLLSLTVRLCLMLIFFEERFTKACTEQLTLFSNSLRCIFQLYSTFISIMLSVPSIQIVCKYFRALRQLRRSLSPLQRKRYRWTGKFFHI